MCFNIPEYAVLPVKDFVLIGAELLLHEIMHGFEHQTERVLICEMMGATLN